MTLIDWFPDLEWLTDEQLVEVERRVRRMPSPSVQRRELLTLVEDEQKIRAAHPEARAGNTAKMGREIGGWRL